MRALTARILGIVAVVLTASAFSASNAAAIETIRSCGASSESNITTSSGERVVSSTAFVDVHSSSFSISLGTLGDCAVVRFTAQSACQGPSANDRCIIRVLDNGKEMLPDGNGLQIFDSESQTPAAHSFEWVSRGLLKGQHTFTIQVRTSSPSTRFVLTNWTAHFELLS